MTREQIIAYEALSAQGAIRQGLCVEPTNVTPESVQAYSEALRKEAELADELQAVTPL